MSEVPQDWRTISIGQIASLLSKADQAELMEILEHKKPLDDNIFLLKRLFKRNAKALEKEGIMAEFLAYAVGYAIETEARGTSGPLEKN